jgi:hypothetical protein
VPPERGGEFNPRLRRQRGGELESRRQRGRGAPPEREVVSIRATCAVSYRLMCMFHTCRPGQVSCVRLYMNFASVCISLKLSNIHIRSETELGTHQV